MTRVLGASWEAGMFHFAWMLPNMLRRQLGEGALGAAFLPAYSAARARSPGDTDPGAGDEAKDLLSAVTGVMLVILAALCAVALVTLWLLPHGSLGLQPEAGAPAGAPEQLFRRLCWVLLPYGIPVCVTAIYAAALQARGRFGLPARMPILLNGFWLAGLGTAVLATGDMADPNVRLPQITWITAWFLAVGGWAQLVVLAVALHRAGAYRLPRIPGLTRRNPRGARAGPVFLTMLPTALGLSTVQISALLDHGMAIYLVDPGANNFIYLANRLLQFPHALTGLALAVAVFPRLASLGQGDTGASVGGAGPSKDRVALAERLGNALSASLLLTVPAAIGMALVAHDLVPVLFEGGEFTAADSSIAAWTTVAVVVGLPAMGSSQIHARAFYAMGLAGTPARISGWMLLLNLALNAWFVLGLDLGTPGLALATSLSSIGNALGLRILLRRRFHRDGIPPADSPLGLWGRVALASAGMAATVAGTNELLSGTAGWVRVAAAVPLGGAAYGGLLVTLRTRELAPILAKLKGKLSR